MKEAQMQTMFGKWLQERKSYSGAYELKIEKGKAFAFNKVKEHQIEALLQIGEGGLYHKIADNPIFAGKKTRFHTVKPFDCVYLRHCIASIVLWYYVPRTPKMCFIIDIRSFLDIVENHTRKSIREYELDEYLNNVEYQIKKVRFA